ncbi:jerky-like protein [Lasius niger]|uniref:Jerky-like protein n=1 Tax=Lasius niger TaxID=67767 RepID=A0A0J7MXF1_LASNI|nr:jerky-like protein [Lasius niger]
MDKNGRLMIGAPPQSIAIPHESGWMNGDIFLQWLQNFKQHVQPSKENPILLILDGHASHKELTVIEYARKNHIYMLSTPPHTTHKLQPLDRTFFKPFKSAYASASAVWMRQNPGARITDYDIAALVDSSFTKAARLEIAQNGFKCTKIYPFNREIFSDIVFLPASMTDVAQEPVSSFTENNANQSSTSRITQLTSEPAPSISTADLLEQLSPLPDASKKRLIRRSRKTQKNEILTFSPCKNDPVAKNKATKVKKLKTKKIFKLSPIKIVVKIQNVSYVEKLLKKTGSNAINAKIGLTKLALTLTHQIFITIVTFAKPKNA